MNWRFTFNQNNSGHSKKEIFDDYEQKYLKKLNKIKSEIQKIQNKQKEIELNELKDRIARRLKLLYKKDLKFYAEMGQLNAYNRYVDKLFEDKESLPISLKKAASSNPPLKLLKHKTLVKT